MLLFMSYVQRLLNIDNHIPRIIKLVIRSLRLHVGDCLFGIFTRLEAIREVTALVVMDSVENGSGRNSRGTTASAMMEHSSKFYYFHPYAFIQEVFIHCYTSFRNTCKRNK